MKPRQQEALEFPVLSPDDVDESYRKISPITDKVFFSTTLMVELHNDGYYWHASAAYAVKGKETAPRYEDLTLELRMTLQSIAEELLEGVGCGVDETEVMEDGCAVHRWRKVSEEEQKLLPPLSPDCRNG